MNGEAAGLYAGLPLLHGAPDHLGGPRRGAPRLAWTDAASAPAAVKYDDLEIVELLLKHGASKSKKDEAGKTARDYAEELSASAEIKALVQP